MNSHVLPRIVLNNVKPNTFSCLGSFLNLSFLETTPGILKISQLLMGSICMGLLVKFGTVKTSLLGMSYVYLLSSVSTSVSTVTTLLLCYLISKPTFSLVRSSIFELVFNVSAFLSCLGSSSYLAFISYVFLSPISLVTLGFVEFPAMTGAYSLGFALALMHGIDAYLCFKHYRGY